MADIRLFGLTIDATSATQSLRTLSATSRDAARAFDQDAAVFNSATRKMILDNEALIASERSRAASLYADRFATDAQAQAMGKLETQAYVLNAAMAEEAAAHAASAGAIDLHGVSLGRLNLAMDSAIARFLGGNTAVARFAGQIGGAAVGMGAMIAVAGGLLAGIAIWKAWHEEASKAKEEQDKLTDALTKWYDKQKEGKAGELPKQIQAMKDKLVELKKQMDDVTSSSSWTKLFAGVAQVGAGGSKASAWGRIFSAGDFTAIANQFQLEVDKGMASTAKAITEGGKAVVAAQIEVDKRLNEEARKAAAERAKIYSEMIQNADEVQRKKVQAEQSLEAEVVSQHKLTEALAISEAAYKAEADAQEIANKVKATGLVLGEEGYQQALEAAAAIIAERNAQAQITQTRKDAADVEKALAKIKVEQEKAVQAQLAETARMTRQFEQEQKQLAQTIERDVLGAIQSLSTNGLSSFKGFFTEIGRLSLNMVGQLDSAMEKMRESFANAVESDNLDLARAIDQELSQLERLKTAAAAVGAAVSAGMAGYQIGQSSGSVGVGVVGGAAAGALAGSAFGPWGAAIGGLVGAAGGLFGAASKQKEAADALAVAAAAEATRLRTAVGNYVNGAPGVDPTIGKLAAENERFNTLLEQLRKTYNNPQIPELIAAHDAYTKAIIDEAAAVAAAAKLATARAEEDAQLRLLAATSDSTYTALKRASDERREIEDLIAKSASQATIDLTKQAQAAEDVAAAARDAAAAQQAQVAASRALAALQVRDLYATGDKQGGDDLAFQLKQKQELEDAIAAKKSQDYIDLLKKTLTDEANQRAATALIASVGGSVSSTAGSVSRQPSVSASSSVSASVTDRTALMLVDLTRAEVSLLTQIEVNTRNGGAGGLVINMYNSFGGGTSTDDINAVIDELEQKLDERLGAKLNLQHIFTGSVRR